jgi:hypothetical protein
MTTPKSEFNPFRLISPLLEQEMQIRKAALNNIRAIGAPPDVVADYENDIVNMQETIKLWNRLADLAAAVRAT